LIRAIRSKPGTRTLDRTRSKKPWERGPGPRWWHQKNTRGEVSRNARMGTASQLCPDRQIQRHNPLSFWGIENTFFYLRTKRRSWRRFCSPCHVILRQPAWLTLDSMTQLPSQSLQGKKEEEEIPQKLQWPLKFFVIELELYTLIFFIKNKKRRSVPTILAIWLL